MGGIPDTVADDQVSVRAGFVAVANGAKLAGRQLPVGQGNTDERVSGSPAEDVGEDGRALVVVFVNPGLEGDESPFALVERRVDRSGLGNELMELERQERVPRSSFLNEAIDRAHPLKGRFEHGPATGFRCA